MQVGDLLSDDAGKSLTLPGNCPVQEAVEKMARKSADAVVVAEDGRPVGTFSGPDLLGLFQKQPAAQMQSVVLKEAMTDRLVVAAPEEEIRPVLARMLDGEIRHLVVLSGDMIVGHLALCDIVKKMFEILDGEIRHLNDYIADLHEAGND